MKYLAIPENIHTPPMDDIELGTQNFRISKKGSSSLCRIPNPADSKSCGIPEFCKTLNEFPGIPVKIPKIGGGGGEFMEFQSGSPSIYYRISNVVHWGCVDIFWNSPLHPPNVVLNILISKAWVV